ncbi:hypothetical protein SISNIDRAFT_505943 [Sistotremastrum niveocremeum HHB9708]|uniref:RRM domain-containing protein n=1 Tax=Sistotremastrum niveocremeum HHB9708 TaxID=1314777 RepID=A0A164UZP4_9AGAM|nr:hypothetical protein SISNIDRAFT_505943 [Sistotremastrum niveocremeum HHB9708]
MFGCVSDGVDNDQLTRLFETCGALTSFTRWMKRRLGSRPPTPVAYGFVEYRDPEGALRSIALLNEVELPALMEGCESQRLFVKAPDTKTKGLLEAYDAQRIKTAFNSFEFVAAYWIPQADEASTSEAQKQIDLFICSLHSAPIISANREPQFTVPLPFWASQDIEPRGKQPQILREIDIFKARDAKRRKIREDQANGQSNQLSHSTTVELDQNSQSHTSSSSSSRILPQSLSATSDVLPSTEEISVDQFNAASHTSPTISRSLQFLQTEETEKENTGIDESSVSGVNVINNISLKRKRDSEVKSAPVQVTETS